MRSFIFSALALLSLGLVSAGEDKVVPEHYDLYLDIDPDTGHIDGRVTITFTPKRSIPRSEAIYIDSDHTVQIQNCALRGDQQVVINATREKDRLKIIASIDLFTNMKYQLTLNFTKKLTEKDPAGIFLSTFKKQSKIVAANFYPNHAHRVFPCFDDPELLAHFSISLVIPSDWEAYSSTHKKSTSKTVQFETTPKIQPSSVMFFLVQGYKEVNVTNATYKPSMYVPSALKMSVLANAKLLQVLNTDYFKKYFEMSGMANIKLVVVPDLPENIITYHGIIAVRPEVVALDIYRSTSEECRVSLSLYRAMAKLFFGAAVATASPNDTWLSDSVATFLQFRAMKSDNFWKNEIVDDLEYAAMTDAFVDAPIAINPNQHAVAHKEIVVSTIKGAAFLRMLNGYRGFKLESTLESYFSEMKYKAVVSTDFLDKLEHGLDKYKFNLRPWVFNRGFPVLTVTPDNKKASIKVTTPGGTEGDWEIPAVYITNVTGTPKIILIKGSYKTDEEVDGIMLNSDARGLYQVSYAEQYYVKLREWMKQEKEPVRRAVMLSSAMYAGQNSKTTNYYYVLNMTSSLINDYDYTPWYVTAQGILELRNILFLTDTYKGFLERFQTLVDEPMAHYGFEMESATDFKSNMIRELIIGFACEIGHPLCQLQATQLFQELTEANNAQALIAKLGTDTLRTIQCSGVSHMNKTQWDDYFKKIYIMSDPDYKRKDALTVLACAKRPIITNFLRNTIRQKIIKKEDKFVALNAIYTKPDNVNITLTQISNWSKNNKKFLTDEWAEVFTGIAPMLHDEHHKALLQMISGQVDKSQLVLKEAIEASKARASMNEELLQNKLNGIKDWVNHSEPDPPLPPSTTPEPTTTSTLPPSSATPSPLPNVTSTSQNPNVSSTTSHQTTTNDPHGSTQSSSTQSSSTQSSSTTSIPPTTSKKSNKASSVTGSSAILIATFILAILRIDFFITEVKI